jgi:hypothetical protein
MKLGTQLILPDGRDATVVYNSLVGVGCKLGLHNPDPADFEGSSGDWARWEPPEGWPWEPDVLLREPWAGCERTGFAAADCVGRECDCEIMRDGLANVPLHVPTGSAKRGKEVT